MNSKKEVKTSKFLSLLLRHKPETLHLQLDAQGWISVDELLAKLQSTQHALTLEELQYVVQHNSKQRFAFNEDQSKIRANQGHSISIELGYTPLTPPPILFHGTALRNLPSIQQSGLLKRQRHHVHLSQDKTTAITVGKRHGKPVVLIIRAQDMQEAGHSFFQSENGVWLTDHVPTAFIEFPY